MTEIIQSVGEIDVLIPCATNTSSFEGGTAVHPTKTIKTENLAADYTVNVIGLFHMVREFLALPSTASGGPKSVIHVSSCAAQLYIPGMAAYCSTKSAANQIVTNFGFDEPEGNVKFYSYHPGSIATPLATEYVPADGVTWEDGEFFVPQIAGLGLFLMNFAVKLSGDFAVWLASPEANFLNGRYVWAAWDVDEMIAMKEKVASDPSLLTMSLVK